MTYALFSSLFLFISTFGANFEWTGSNCQGEPEVAPAPTTRPNQIRWNIEFADEDCTTGAESLPIRDITEANTLCYWGIRRNRYDCEGSYSLGNFFMHKPSQNFFMYANIFKNEIGKSID